MEECLWLNKTEQANLRGVATIKKTMTYCPGDAQGCSENPSKYAE